MKQMPKIQKYMTTQPHTVGRDITVKKAMEMMREFGIRHLPVQDGGHLVGMITDRDIKLANAFGAPDTLSVEEVMTPEPYEISPNASLAETVETMAEHKYGSAVIMDNKKVVGIFTAVDGLRVLCEVLKQNFKE
jgi:acetoin utilization protein AcuB